MVPIGMEGMKKRKWFKTLRVMSNVKAFATGKQDCWLAGQPPNKTDCIDSYVPHGSKMGEEQEQSQTCAPFINNGQCARQFLIKHGHT